jgi:signal transducing adaptor molecule
LKPIQTAYDEIKTGFTQYFPPDKPQKQTMSIRETQQEEDDLKAAIALSLQESTSSQPIQNQTKSQSLPQAHPLPQQAEPPQPQSFSRVRALYDSFSEDPADLKFRKGDIITVIERVYKDWGKGSLRGKLKSCLPY